MLLASINKLVRHTMAFNDERARYLSMSLTEKRREYQCGDSYMTLASIQTLRQSTNGVKDSLDDSMDSLCDKISVFVGDITTLEVDAIVNAANKHLMPGGGVHRQHTYGMPSVIEPFEHRISGIIAIRIGIIMTAILPALTLLPLLLPVLSTTYDIQDLPLSPRQVQTKYGTLRGVIIPLRSPTSATSTLLASLSPVEAFFGVPYAAPPIKTLRFMPPVTLSKWRGVRLATRYSP
ncbi:unnamed protein product, partial [Oppiella nova]